MSEPLVRRFWHSYQAELIAKGADPAEVGRNEKAFYLGASAVLLLFDGAARSEPREAGFEVYMRVRRELEAFQKECLSAKAAS